MPIGDFIAKQVTNAVTKTAENALNKLGLGRVLGISGKKNEARGQASLQDQFNSALEGDWRVRLSLADSDAVNYLYKDPSNKILAPLSATNGVIFPYTPSISVNYVANYDATALTHSNYRVFQYQNSAVENITVGCDFTAQDTFEANYMLAVIHFLRSATKMFYGSDTNPIAGTPPPLCFLHGLGTYQFNGHPLVINGFNYSLPTDVDYIRAYITDTPGTEVLQEVSIKSKPTSISSARANSGPTQVGAGGQPAAAQLSQGTGSTVPTWVPTKMNIQFSAYPIVSRNDVSNAFSFKDYANGSLLNGSQRPNKAGMW